MEQQKNKYPNPGQAPNFKICPFCAEQIKFQAIKCRYCGEFLPPTTPATDVKEEVDEKFDTQRIPVSPDNEESGKAVTKDRKHTSFSQILLYIILFVSAIAIFMHFIEQFNLTSASNNPNTEAESNNSFYTTQDGYVGFYSEEDLGKYMRMVNVGDEKAIEEMYRFGRIIPIPPDAKAFVIKSTWGGSVKIRLEGRTQEIWTVTQAIKK